MVAIITWMSFLSSCYFTQLRKIQYLLVFAFSAVASRNVSKCDKVIHMWQETVAVWKAVCQKWQKYLCDLHVYDRFLSPHLNENMNLHPIPPNCLIKGIWQRITKRPGCFSGTSYKENKVVHGFVLRTLLGNQWEPWNSCF